MPGRITRKPQAIHDAEECAAYLRRDNLMVAFRFLTALERALKLLAEFPGVGREREFRGPITLGLRSFGVPGFQSHLVFYRPLEDGIEVVRILHGARDLDGLFADDLPTPSED